MKRIIYVPILFVLFFIGCSDDTTGPAAGKGAMKIYMIDAPSIYDSVVVCISRVDVHTAGSAENDGWITLNDSTRYFDLLQLTNGANVLLGDAELDAGHYTQIRLIVTAESYIVLQGIKYFLNIPSGFETGIKLVHQFTIESGITYNLILDFDADRSILFEGNGIFTLNPVIRVMPLATSGSISGQILPIEASVIVWTVVGSDTTSTFTNESGNFKLMALPEGTFDVNITSGTQAYADTTISGVQVTAGSDTDIGVITLTAP